MKDDAISRQAAKEAYCNTFCHPGAICPDGLCKEVNEAFDAVPSAEPVRMKGKWIPIQRGFFNKDVTQVKCGQCGNLLDLIGVNCGRGDANYCPNCGARMSEGEEDE